MGALDDKVNWCLECIVLEHVYVLGETYTTGHCNGFIVDWTSDWQDVVASGNIWVITSYTED